MKAYSFLCRSINWNCTDLLSVQEYAGHYPEWPLQVSGWEGGCRSVGRYMGEPKGVYVGGCMWEVGEGDTYVGGWGGREVTSVDHWEC